MVEVLSLVGACEGAGQSDVIVEAGSLRHPTKSAIRRPVAPGLGGLNCKPVHIVEVGLAGRRLGRVHANRESVLAAVKSALSSGSASRPSPATLLGEAADSG